MTIFKKLTALALTLLLLLPPGITSRAAEPSTDQLVRRLINYYHHYQQDARVDCALILAEIEKQDPELAATWTSILDFWSGVNNDMQFHSDILPDGLPEDDSLCIVIMGYYLKSDGSMRDELYQRMQVALASAQKYPNAYILCTGGGTAAENPKVTEASQMAKWLKNKGIDPDRIIVEKQARSTIQNATYGCALLYKDYPQIKNLALITSDYHIYRSCLYFHVEAALEAYEAGIEPMTVISNASCRIDPKATRDIDRQVEGVGMLTDLDVLYMKKEPLSQLESISVSGQSEYAHGADLNLTVTAHFSNNLSMDVTHDAEFTDFDMNVAGFHSVSVCYDEVIETYDIYVIPPETEPEPMQIEPEETVPETPTQIPVTPDTDAENPSVAIIGVALGLLLLLIVLICLKIRQEKKRRRRRRPRPTIKLD